MKIKSHVLDLNLTLIPLPVIAQTIAGKFTSQPKTENFGTIKAKKSLAIKILLGC